MLNSSLYIDPGSPEGGSTRFPWRIHRGFYLLFPVLSLIWFAVLIMEGKQGICLDVDMRAEKGTVAQLFWSTGAQPYSETSSVRAALQPRMRETVRFCTGQAYLQRVRFDPTDEVCTLTIYSIAATLGPFSLSWGNKKGFAGWTANQNAAIKDSRGTLTVTALSGDPSIEIDTNGAGRELALAIAFLPFFCAFISAIALLLLYFLRRRIFSAWADANSSVEQHVSRLALYRALGSIAQTLSVQGLVCFNRKAVCFILATLLLFSAAVALKLHGSSLKIWYRYLPEKSAWRETVLGEPRAIRSDEWLVATPALLSQTAHNPKFPSRNQALGAGHTPLVFGLPARHFSSYFHLENAGFLLLDQERGFSFWWNYKALGIFLGAFLVIFLVTGGAFWVSFLGAVWFYYSAFTQWWLSSSLSAVMGPYSFGLTALFYLIYDKRKTAMLIAACVCSVSALDFVLALYPPFQIPLVWLSLFIVSGKLISSPVALEEIRRFPRILLFLAAAAFVLSFAGLFLSDANETIQILQNTVYPGKRFETGGSMPLKEAFAGLLDPLLTEGVFPTSLGNVCEASSFLFLWPIAALSMLSSFARGTKPEAHSLALLAYLMILFAFMLLGFNERLAQASLLYLVPPKRALLAAGFANVLLVCDWLSRARSQDRISSHAAIGFALAAAALLFPALAAFSEQMTAPISSTSLWSIVIVAALLVFFMLTLEKALSAVVIVSFTFGSNFFVNPLSSGLSPLTDNQLAKTAQAIVRRDTAAKWVVFDDIIIPNALKAAGANVLGGVKFVPDADFFKTLDSDSSDAHIYNRYAHHNYTPLPAEAQPSFYLNQADLITVAVSPCGSEFSKLDVNYFLFPYRPDPRAASCLKRVSPVPFYGRWHLYKRR